MNMACANSAAATMTFFPYSDTTFPGSFESANRVAWKKIIDEPLYSMPSSAKISVLVAHAKTLWNFVDDLKNCTTLVDALKNMFVDRSLITQSERERICIQIQSMRLLKYVIQDFISFVMRHIPSAALCSCKQLFQVWLRKVVIEIWSDVAGRYSNIESGPKHIVHPLNDVDQNVLFYICGYMVMKLKTACKMYKKLRHMDAMIQSLATKAGSNNKVCLQTTMHEAFMVNYYWNIIIEMIHQNELACLPVLGYIISLFITIKGFATARKERDCMAANHSKKTKHSKSLRGTLKKI